MVPAAVRRGVRRWTRNLAAAVGVAAAQAGAYVSGRRRTRSNRSTWTISTAPFRGRDRERLFAQRRPAMGHRLRAILAAIGTARPNASPLSRMLYADQKTYLVELLMKQDQMSMACSIESRVPLLDHPLVEFAARVPDQLKIRDGVGKYIFKKAVGGPAAARDRVPHEDGISDAAAPMAAGCQGGALIRVAAYPQWPAARVSGSHRARSSDRPASKWSRRRDRPDLAPAQFSDLGSRSFWVAKTRAR